MPASHGVGHRHVSGSSGRRDAHACGRGVGKSGRNVVKFGPVRDVPVLTTRRLFLRPWREADRSAFAEMNGDPRVTKYFPSPLTPSESDALMDRIVDDWRRGYGLWAVQRRDEDDFIGFLGFSQPRWQSHFTPCIEIGWRLVATSWNQGFATEGAFAAVSWGRANIEFPRNEIVSFTTTVNIPSRRVMEKLGMTHDEADDFDHPLLPDWDGRRHVLYRLTVSSRREESSDVL